MCILIEVPFSPAFDRFAIAFIFSNVRNNAMIPEHLTGSLRIEAFICIEEGTFVGEPTAFHVRKKLLERVRHVICIVMIASNDPCCGDDIAVFIRQWQDIAGLGFLPSLIRDAFAPFFATVWLPSRCSSDKFNSYRTAMIPASTRR